MHLNEGLALSLKIGNKDIIKNSYKSLSILEKHQGNFEQALEYLNKYAHYKDSLINDESSNQIAFLKIKYETEKKDQEIALLNKDNEIKALQLKQQKVSIINAALESEKNKNEIDLLNSTMEIQRLKLSKAQGDLEFQEAEAQMKDAQLVLLNKDRELKAEQLQRQKFVRNTMISGTMLLMLVGLLFYRSLRLRKKLEKQQVILEERKRISQDLHDDIGSGLSKIMLLSELVKHDAKLPGTRKGAEKISSISQELSSNISEIIWSLNANNDYVDNLVAYIRRYAAEYFDNTPVKLKIKTPKKIDDKPIRTENRRNIFFAVKEALHNILKHSEATEVKLNFELDNNILSVIIRDNGVGMPKGKLNPFGNGLKNMKHRMMSIDGDMNIENGQGTQITFRVPV
jgi:signal transduction histidine kinase